MLMMARTASGAAPPGAIGRGRLRGVARVAAQAGSQLRDPRRELLDHVGLSGDEREQLLTRRILRPGHETT